MGLFGKILKTGFDVVTSPIEVVKDVATLGGLATGENETYTGKRLKQLGNDIENVGESLEDL